MLCNESVPLLADLNNYLPCSNIDEYDGVIINVVGFYQKGHRIMAKEVAGLFDKRLYYLTHKQLFSQQPVDIKLFNHSEQFKYYLSNYIEKEQHNRGKENKKLGNNKAK